MSPGRQERLQRRWALEQRSSELRERLTAHAQTFAPLWTAAERTRQGVGWLKRHPVVPLAVAALLLLRRPRRMVRWGGRLWALWGSAQRLRGWWHMLRGGASR